MTMNIEQPDQERLNSIELVLTRGVFEAGHLVRRGLITFEDGFVYYDGTLSTTRDGVQRRDELLVELREFLEQCGLEEMASISYPEPGANQGRVFAIVISANGRITDEELESTVREGFEEIIREFNRRLPCDDRD